MKETKSGADWLGDWQALQQRYWTSMGEMARKAGENAQAAQGPGMPKWHEGLEIWSRAFQGGTDGPQQHLERALGHGKAYLDMLQRLGGLAAQPAGQALPQDWSAAFTEMMQGLTPGFGATDFKALQGARSIEQMMADIEPMLSMFLGEARTMLGAQPFGMAREHQERQQALAAAVLAYQQASAGYQRLLARSLERGIEIFEGKLADRSEPGRHIESPKALYDLWIDAAEEGYAEVAMSQDFQDAYGALVNTQMRVRQLLQDQVERLAAVLGMPTRSEMNSVHRKLAALKRAAGASATPNQQDPEVERPRVQKKAGSEPGSGSKSAKTPLRAAKSTSKLVTKPAGKSTTKKPQAKSNRPSTPGGRAKGTTALRKRKLSR